MMNVNEMMKYHSSMEAYKQREELLDSANPALQKAIVSLEEAVRQYRKRKSLKSGEKESVAYLLELARLLNEAVENKGVK